MRQTRTKHIVMALLTTLAATITVGGCSQDEASRCVDQDGRVLPDAACQGTTVHGIYRYPHRVYGGGGGFSPGSYAHDYSSSPRSSSIFRGGFGFHGGFGGGHGGGGE